jgi:hypothetical protein
MDGWMDGWMMDATDPRTPMYIFTVYNPEKKHHCTVYPHTHREYRKSGTSTKITNRSIHNGMFSVRALFERWRLRVRSRQRQRPSADSAFGK